VVVLDRAKSFGAGRARPSPSLRDLGAKAVLVERERPPSVDVIGSKVTVPQVRRDTVSRTALVNRLRAGGAFPLVVVVAPAGYGKTTLLAQWAAKDARPFAWLSIDERDNDPLVLLRHLAAALDRIAPLEPGILEALATPQTSVWDSIVPRLTTHLSSRDSPLVLVFDDIDLLESEEAIAIVAALIENVPAKSMVALVGRKQSRLPVASLRVGAPLLEIGAYELALSRRETEMLLRACGVELAEDQLLDLLQLSEGWAAGIYLTALAARAEGDGAHVEADGRYLADYVEAEYLERLTPDERAFLRRTSVLEKMNGALCDAVLKRDDSAASLGAVERSNLFLAPVDRERGWYRYHPLFRDLLRRELADVEPDLVRVLNQRAAKWYEAHDDPEAALGHAHAAGDSDEAARILSSIALKVHHSGRASLLETWLGPFDDDDRLERYPAVAVNGSRIHAVRGRPEEAERWLAAAERAAAGHRKGIAAVRPCISVMRSALCANGPAKMLADAEAAVAKLRSGTTWRPSALLVEGAAAILLGNDPKADALLAEAALEAERLGSTETRVIALGERSLVAAARGDYHEAEALATEACELLDETELTDYSTSALALAVSARAMLRHGLWEKARKQLTLAQNVLPALTHALPWLAVQARLELGHACVTLRDHDAARQMLEEACDVLAVKPKLGVLTAAVEALAEEIDAMPANGNGASSGLTAAELRLLPLLSTHLSFREIGQRLFVSRNTIKTQAISVYRKLGVSSRSEAIERAIVLGLVDAEHGLSGADEEHAGRLRPLDSSRMVAS
jgi:LuxR family transcriptional regulator, maltose regulon positive regulatory protein